MEDLFGVGTVQSHRLPETHILSDKEFFDLLVLQVLEEAAQPVGSGTLAEALARQGHEIGEATAGRWLRELESRGYVDSVGRQGRILNDRGRSYLFDLKTRRVQWEMASQLARVLLTLNERQLLDILITRRALEAEAAALAAQHATTEQLRRLAAIVQTGHGLDDPAEHAQYDLDFHFAVADASNNNVLAAAIRMVRSTEPRFPVFVHIRRSLGRRTLQDHLGVYEAIAARTPEAARQRMLEHIDHVIEDVHRYWQTGGEGA